MKTYTGAVLFLCVLVHCATAAAQQANPLQLSTLSDPDWRERAHTYEQIKSNEDLRKRSDVKQALVGLLDRENKVIHFPFVNSNGEVIGASGKYGEGYTEYYYDLADTVSNLADWQDPQQLCVLAEGSYNPDSRFAARLVTEGGAAVAPCLLKRAQGALSDRREAIPVLAQLAGVATLSPSIMQQVRQAVMSGLEDSDPVVRQTTVQAVGRFGTQEMIPALQSIASSDPVSRPLKNGQLRFDIREAASKAIQSIEERAKTK